MTPGIIGPFFHTKIFLGEGEDGGDLLEAPEGQADVRAVLQTGQKLGTVAAAAAASLFCGRAQFPCFDVSVRKSIHGDVERFRAYY